MRSGPIGIFDSGFGGLTVLRALVELLPYEKMVYLGDTARLPYGNKSAEIIIRYSIENCSFLEKQGAKCIVVACNTATALALDAIRSHFTIPIIGVIQPVIEEMGAAKTSSKVGVLATRSTVQSSTYQTLIKLALPQATVTAIAAPLLVSLVEEGCIEHPITYLAVEQYCQPLKEAGVDSVVLGCTHFPLLKEVIQRSLGGDVKVIDPAFHCAKATLALLNEQSLLSPIQEFQTPSFYVTDDPKKFIDMGPLFLGKCIASVEFTDLCYSAN